MHMCETSQLENRLEDGSKSNEMLVTRKLPKTTYPQITKSKMEVKDTSENANKMKAGARF